MDGRILFAAAQVLICIRDARLVAVRASLAWWWLPATIGAAAACGFIAERLSSEAARGILQDTRFWWPALALHAAVGLWSAGLGWRDRRPDWIAVAPTPISCVAWTGVSREALIRFDDLSGPIAGATAGLACVGVSALMARILRNRETIQPALRFSALTHLCALCLLPASTVLDRPIPAHRVDWRSTGIVLPSVLALAGLSFAWHRLRERLSTRSK